MACTNLKEIELADYLEYAGRELSDVQFTGLLESLTIIGLIGETGKQAAAHLRKEDLLSMMEQMREEAVKCIAFSGASADEAKAMNRHMMKGMRLDYE